MNKIRKLEFPWFPKTSKNLTVNYRIKSVNNIKLQQQSIKYLIDHGGLLHWSFLTIIREFSMKFNGFLKRFYCKPNELEFDYFWPIIALLLFRGHASCDIPFRNRAYFWSILSKLFSRLIFLDSLQLKFSLNEIAIYSCNLVGIFTLNS